MFITSISNDGTIVAVVPSSKVSTSSSGIINRNKANNKNVRITIPLYQLDSTTNKYHLQTTLATTVETNDSSGVIIKKLIFCKNTNFLCVHINTDNKIIVFDIIRGVYVRTIQPPSDKQYKLIDIVTSCGGKNDYLYMLCVNTNDNKVFVLQTDATSGKVTHKLKCGKIEGTNQEEEKDDTTSGTIFDVYNDDVVAVLLKGSNKIKVYKLNTGDSIGKCKLPSKDNISSDVKRQVVFSNDGKVVGLFPSCSNNGGIDLFGIKKNDVAFCGNMFLTSSQGSQKEDDDEVNFTNNNLYIRKKKNSNTYTVVLYDESNNNNEGLLHGFELSSDSSSAKIADVADVNNSSKKKSKRKSMSSSMQIVATDKQQKNKVLVSSKQSDHVRIMSILLYGDADANDAAVVLYDQRQQSTHIQQVGTTTSKNVTVSIPSADEDDDGEDQKAKDTSSSSSNKRKLTEDTSASRSSSNKDVQILGPGQDGGEMLGVTDYQPSSNKKRKQNEEADDEEKKKKEDDKEEEVEEMEGDDIDDDDDEDDNENIENQPSIAERLELLAKEMDNDDDDDDDDDEEEDDEDEDEDKMDTAMTTTDSSSNNKQLSTTKVTSTESLLHLLKQALKSNDDTMLELALSVRDKNVISQTINEIIHPGSTNSNSEDDDDTNNDVSFEINDEKKSEEASLLITTLISKLTSRLVSKPNRASDMSLWLSIILQQTYCSSSSSNKEVLFSNNKKRRQEFLQQQLVLLRPLRNLINERVESFSHLLKLDGRLSLLQNKY